MMRSVLVIATVWLLSACGPTVKKCTSNLDCGLGQICSSGTCQTSGSTGGSGNNGDGGTGGSGGGTTGTGGSGAGGGTATTGCDPTATDNLTRDTDCDGLTDSEEYNVDIGGQKTDPCNSDSDGDGVNDGIELGRTMATAGCGAFVGDADGRSKTNPTVADTDGDGLSDGAEDTDKNGRLDTGETNPLRIDTDCDGASDNTERMSMLGCGTDPTKKDTDGDGLQDGVEAGLQAPGADPAGCAYVAAVTFDADGATKTDACVADSDGDGIQDGAEDTNHNGKVDPGELNPKDMTDGSGPAQQACATANLKPIAQQVSGVPDLQIALVPSFSELTRLTDNGTEKGMMFYDPTSKVAGLIFSKTPSGADAAAEETAARGRLGAVSNALVRTATTWDGFSTATATYSLAGNGDLKTVLNTIANNYLGNTVMGTLPGTAGSTGPFKVQAQYIRRSATRAVVVIALVRDAAPVPQAQLFQIDDVAGGTAVAQFGDFTATQCEVFNASVNQQVDFLWVVDDSCSMQSSQTAVSAAGTLFGQRLQAAGLDWRAGGVSTGFFGNGWDGSYRDFTNMASVMTSWFTGNTAFGTGGAGSEQGFSGAQAYINRTGPNGTTIGMFRATAQAHVIFLTDTREHSNISVADMTTFMNGKFTQKWTAHGIVCPEGGDCGDDAREIAVGKYHTLIRGSGGVLASIETFKPANPNAAQTAAQAQVIDAIVAAVIGGTGHQLQRPPISPTIKVAIQTGGTRGACNVNDVPRDRTNGWDIDSATRRISFFGNCIPANSNVKVAVSYRFWNDGSPNPNGDPCGGSCGNELVCNPNTATCECAPNCGGRCTGGLVCAPATCTCDPQIG